MSEDRDWDLIRGARRQISEVRGQSNESATRTLASAHGSKPGDALTAADRFTNYRLIGEIHRGGQGVVYKATQLSTQREVAIKVLREGPFAGASDRIRFEREIHVLAGLRHPNIVTIHDSGASAGFFYFVMDYIPGRPLDEYVRDVERTTGKRIDLRECLTLFSRICDAMNVAHLRGVIHRDLKPGNIRVDHAGEPHILDFGLAKLSELDDVASARTAARTVTGQFVGSLPWASPEQTEGRPEVIDVRTDVYSLGVLLYQMLTGCFPYEITGNMRTLIDNIANALPKSPRSFRSDINHEVETIVLKCLSKEPGRRYQSAGELGREIQRYLRGEAIDAKRDSTTYILGKHLRRHRVPVALAAALFVSVIGFSIWMSFLYADARAARDSEMAQRKIAEASERESIREATKAKESVGFLRGLFESANPTEARGRELTVRELLDDGARRLRKSLVDQPEVRLELLNTIAIAYRELGRFDDAKKLLAQGLAEHREGLGPDHPLIARTLYGLARLEDLASNPEEAERLASESLKMRERLFGRSHPHVAACLAFMGVLNMNRDRFEEAESQIAEALDILRRCSREGSTEVEPTDVAVCMTRLASLYESKGDFAAAESKYREALAIYRSEPGDIHPDVAGTLESLASTLQYQRDYAGAEALLTEALAINLRVYDENHPRVATALNLLGANCFYTGANDKAESYFKRALAIRRAYWGDEHDEVATTLNNLATLKANQGDLVGAKSAFEEVLAIYRKIWGDDHSQMAIILNNLAGISRLQGDFEAAEKYYREALEIGRKHFDESHPHVQTPLAGLGMMLLKNGDATAAEPVLRDVLSGREQAEPPDAWMIALARSTLGECLASQRRFEEAETLLVNALPIIEDVAAEKSHLVTYRIEALVRIVDLYEAWDKPAKADEWRRKLDTLKDAVRANSEVKGD
ncbi:MAG: serine/threonine protein kinase [Phycisphaerales bacterium]|nr:serine/threonine protein kinase [Phycisphaerales bacterium]MCB9862316.1 serine/threonine protein kinase [Phycisphaerales bacterium]